MAAGVLTLCTTSGFPGVFCAMFLSSSSSFLSSPALLLASHRVYVCLRKGSCAPSALPGPTLSGVLSQKMASFDSKQRSVEHCANVSMFEHRV